MGYWYSEDAGRWTLLGFAIFVLAGGLVAWYRRRSRVSLVSSSVCAFFLLLGFVLSFWFPIIAFAIGAIVALNLAINFAVRLQATRKFMPAGMLMIISLAVFGFLVYLAARAPVKGLPDYKSKRALQPPPTPRHTLTLPAVGLGRAGGGGKDAAAVAEAPPQPTTVRLRARRRG